MCVSTTGSQELSDLLSSANEKPDLDYKIGIFMDWNELSKLGKEDIRKKLVIPYGMDFCIRSIGIDGCYCVCVRKRDWLAWERQKGRITFDYWFPSLIISIIVGVMGAMATYFILIHSEGDFHTYHLWILIPVVVISVLICIILERRCLLQLIEQENIKKTLVPSLSTVKIELLKGPSAMKVETDGEIRATNEATFKLEAGEQICFCRKKFSEYELPGVKHRILLWNPAVGCGHLFLSYTNDGTWTTRDPFNAKWPVLVFANCIDHEWIDCMKVFESGEFNHPRQHPLKYHEGTHILYFSAVFESPVNTTPIPGFKIRLTLLRGGNES